MSAGAGGLPEDQDLRAAEYVLGTLPAAERSALDAERLVHPEMDAAIHAWERRFAPLSLAAGEVIPPPRVWKAIFDRLPAAKPEPANDNRVVALKRQVGRWRGAALGAGLVAACLALFVAVGPRVAEEPESGRYVAVVTSGGELPALIVSVDTRSGTAQVRPVQTQAPSGRSLELWYVGSGPAPTSLGLVGAGVTRVSLPADAARGGEGLFAVSVEPPGGSPTGQPTGQILYKGKLIRD